MAKNEILRTTDDQNPEANFSEPQLNYTTAKSEILDSIADL